MDIVSVGKVYQQLSKSNLHTLEPIYHKAVIFEDSAHRIEGWDELKRYFESLYANVSRCEFDVQEHQQVGENGFLTWVMRLDHPKLQGGKTVNVHGVSHLRFQDGLVIYHRDYFDLGEMIYENLPLLGSVIKYIKQRLGS